VPVAANADTVAVKVTSWPKSDGFAALVRTTVVGVEPANRGSVNKSGIVNAAFFGLIRGMFRS
jgi:hypothetical protein